MLLHMKNWWSKKDREKWSSYFLFFFKKIIFSEAQKKNFFICREGKGKKFCNIVSCYNFLLLFIELTSQLHPSCLCLAGLATVFENQRKSLIHHCEHSELSLLKVTLKCQKLVDFGEFLKTVLPDRSVLIRQNSNATFWFIFKQCERCFLDWWLGPQMCKYLYRV